ncbi:MAG: hypothetical protein OXI27_10890 [Thaumarchaeota archaeon]|nr:hypothetical protein [Nitrososphaerota archaeon]
MYCKGICARYTTRRRYVNDKVKSCSTCNIFIETDKIKCPCCGLRMRTGSRNFGKQRAGQ